MQMRIFISAPSEHIAAGCSVQCEAKPGINEISSAALRSATPPTKQRLRHWADGLGKVHGLPDPFCLMDVLTKICERDNLLRSLLDLRGRAKPGSWSGDLRDSPSTVLDAIANSLLTGRYEFIYRAWIHCKPGYEPVESDIPSRKIINRKARGIISLNSHDRLVQRAMIRIIRDPIILYSANNIAFGSKRAPGDSPQSIDKMAKQVASVRRERSCPVLRLDIQKFFPSIDRARLTEMLRVCLDDSSAEGLFLAYMNGKLEFDPKVEEEDKTKLWFPDVGIPQGTLIAPLLSALYLHSFDRSLEADGLTAFRYVDDLIVVCDKHEPEILFGRLKARLWDDFRLVVPDLEKAEDSKCRIFWPDQDVEVVGFRITPQGYVRPMQRGEDSIVRRFVSHFLDEDDNPREGFCRACHIASQSLESWYRVYSSIVKTNQYWSSLDSRIGRCLDYIADKHSFLHSLRHKPRRELMSFFGITRFTSLEPTWIHLSEQEVCALLEAEYESGAFDVITDA